MVVREDDTEYDVKMNLKAKYEELVHKGKGLAADHRNLVPHGVSAGDGDFSFVGAKTSLWKS